MKKKVLVIVAHPDDEIIWMGGTLLRNGSNWDTAIISLCRRDDEDREPKFRKVCRILGAKCFISDLDDKKLDEVPIGEVTKRIKKYSGGRYDYIFTHGKNGEYGHKRHIDANRAVSEMLKEKLLSARKIFFFSYTGKKGICYADKNSDKFIKLGNDQFKKKKKLIQDIYGFGKNSFEYLCCQNVEAFDIQEEI